MPQATIDWKPFSLKHKQYIRKAMQCEMSVAEGAVRSGKTIDNCIIASMHIDTCDDKLHLASGSTSATAKMNIGDCNGYGLEHLFRGRCRWGKYKGNECLYITDYKGREKIVVFVGGGKSDSFKKIRGNSFGLWIATEINLHYDDDEGNSFIKEAFNRQAAAKQPRVLWDLNPSAPQHKIYTDYIDLYKDIFKGGYNYQHFTIADNLSISPERRAAIVSKYNKGSIWYQRDILGRRCVAEGLIYRQFADSPQDYAVTLAEGAQNLVMANIGIDFGGTGSATTFVLTGRKKDGSVVALLSERHAETLDPVSLEKAFSEFVRLSYSVYKKAMYCYCDSAEQILIRGLRATAMRQALPVMIRNALKRPIIDRIRFVSRMIASDRLKISNKAQTVSDALSEALWDKKHEDTRLDDGTTDIDTLDAFEYSMGPWMNELAQI